MSQDDQPQQQQSALEGVQQQQTQEGAQLLERVAKLIDDALRQHRFPRSNDEWTSTRNQHPKTYVGLSPRDNGSVLVRVIAAGGQDLPCTWEKRLALIEQSFPHPLKWEDDIVHRSASIPESGGPVVFAGLLITADTKLEEAQSTFHRLLNEVWKRL